MYYNHNLRTNLQEWKNRLYRATFEQFGHQLKYFMANIENNKMLLGLINEASTTYSYTTDTMSEIADQLQYGNADLNFENDKQHASFCYQFLKYSITELKSYDLHRFTSFNSGDFNQTKNNIVEEYISPLIYFFHDSLEKSNSVIYLLEKYKKRTEWFTKQNLLSKYYEAEKSYEQIFEDDLRMFLFDQGIDYPFSTPKSTSGRADIIGSIDTSDPIVIEIKIFDRDKSYGKNRIKEGFSQILKYTNDYNKDIGYLVLFNADKAELNFDFADKSKIFPPMLSFNNKTYYFVVVNVFDHDTASKIGTTEVITIGEDDLTK